MPPWPLGPLVPRPCVRPSALTYYAKPAAAAQKSKVNIASLAYCQRLSVVGRPTSPSLHDQFATRRKRQQKQQHENIVGVVGFGRRLVFWCSCVATKLRSLLVGRSFLLTSLVSCWLLGSSWLKLFVCRAPHQCGARRDSQSQAEASSQSNAVNGGSESNAQFFEPLCFTQLTTVRLTFFTWQLKQLQRMNAKTKTKTQTKLILCVLFFLLIDNLAPESNALITSHERQRER